MLIYLARDNFVLARERQTFGGGDRLRIQWIPGEEFPVALRPWRQSAPHARLGSLRDFQFLGIGYGTFLVGAPAMETSPDANQ